MGRKRKGTTHILLHAPRSCLTLTRQGLWWQEYYFTILLWLPVSYFLLLPFNNIFVFVLIFTQLNRWERNGGTTTIFKLSKKKINLIKGDFELVNVRCNNWNDPKKNQAQIMFQPNLYLRLWKNYIMETYQTSLYILLGSFFD